MSDTPRTDAVDRRLIDLGIARPLLLLELAGDLERRLADRDAYAGRLEDILAGPWSENCPCCRQMHELAALAKNPNPAGLSNEAAAIQLSVASGPVGLGPSVTPNPFNADAACKLIEDALRSYRCLYWRDGEPHREEGLPLVDVLTPQGAESIAPGIEELKLLAEHLFDELPEFVTPAIVNESKE